MLVLLQEVEGLAGVVPVVVVGEAAQPAFAG